MRNCKPLLLIINPVVQEAWPAGFQLFKPAAVTLNAALFITVEQVIICNIFLLLAGLILSYLYMIFDFVWVLHGFLWELLSFFKQGFKNSGV